MYLKEKIKKKFRMRKKPVQFQNLFIIIHDRKIQIDLRDSWNNRHGIAWFSYPRFIIIIILKAHFYGKSVKIISKKGCIPDEFIKFVGRFLQNFVFKINSSTSINCRIIIEWIILQIQQRIFLWLIMDN